jgi:GTPase SAR1 family protein
MIELGLMNAQGRELIRTRRGIGGRIESPGEGPLFDATDAPLDRAEAGRAYIFRIQRDDRVTATDSYQIPTLRFAVPVFDGEERIGYLTTVIEIDTLITQNFVYAQTYRVNLFDADSCILATSDDALRRRTYETWANASLPCTPTLPLAEWDISAKQAGDQIFSSRVIHGPLMPSRQAWTIVIEQPTSIAFAQANLLTTLLSSAHLLAGLVVVALIFGADQATKRLVKSDRDRLATHARDTRFNPFVINGPVDDPRLFFGRMPQMAQLLGGMMGGANVFIIGDPGAGKTSLLRQVERRLANQQIPDTTYDFVPIWVDLQGVPSHLFYGVLMEHILLHVPDHEQTTELQFHMNAVEYGLPEFREDINEIIALPEAAGGKERRFVLCLDNAQFWFSQDTEANGFNAEFITAFRDIFIDVGLQLRAIIAGRDLPMTLRSMTDTTISVGVFDPDESRRLLNKSLTGAYAIDDDAVELTLAMSDCRPAELQRLGRYAVQLMLEQDAPTITVTHVQRAAARASADWEPLYRALWYGGTGSLRAQDRVARLTAAEQAAIRKAIETTGPVLLEDLRVGRYGGALYTAADSTIRLTALFREWVERQPKERPSAIES